MKNVVIFCHSLLNEKVGSSEKLLICIAQILSKSNLFQIHIIYASNEVLSIPKPLELDVNIHLYPFRFECINTFEPFSYINTNIELNELITKINPHLLITLVWGNTQEFIRNLSNKIPLLLISPFGSFTTNGNVRKTYVSGYSNKNKLFLKGVINSEVFFNPLVTDNLPKNKFLLRPLNRTILIGRSGRSNEEIFDPISLYAFRKLELKYGDKVKFIYLNPCYKAKLLSINLGIVNIEFHEWLSNDELKDFYLKIDIFAHSRKDGETLGVAIGEAMLYQNVVVTHISNGFNDHLYLLKEPYGKISKTDDIEGYFNHLEYYVENLSKLNDWSMQAQKFAFSLFDYNIISNKIIKDCLYASNYYLKPQNIFIRLWFSSVHFLFKFYYKFFKYKNALSLHN